MTGIMQLRAPLGRAVLYLAAFYFIWKLYFISFSFFTLLTYRQLAMP